MPPVPNIKTFARPSTVHPHTRFSPLVLQKRTVLSKLRNARILNADSLWQKSKSMAIVKELNLKAKLEGIKVAKKVKEDGVFMKKEVRREKKREEKLLQRRVVDLKRAGKIGCIEKANGVAATTYNSEISASILTRREFKEEMEGKKREKKEREMKDKEGLKSMLVEKMDVMQDRKEKEKVRDSKTQALAAASLKKAVQERAAIHLDVMAMRSAKEALASKIEMEKRETLNKRKVKWHEDFKRGKKQEEMERKREGNIEKREEGRAANTRKETVTVKGGGGRNDALVRAVQRRFGEVPVAKKTGKVAARRDRKIDRRSKKATQLFGGDGRVEEEVSAVPSSSPSSEENFFTDFNINVTPTKFNTAGSFDSMDGSPVTPKDFFSHTMRTGAFDEEQDEDDTSPTSGTGTVTTEATARHSNKIPEKGRGGGFEEDGPSCESGEREGTGFGEEPAGLQHTPGVPGLVSHTKKETPSSEASIAARMQFSSPVPHPNFNSHTPLSGSFVQKQGNLKRGFSFAYTPAVVPSDAEIDKMSPLQRTYTALKLKRGEDPAVARMKDLINNATG